MLMRKDFERRFKLGYLGEVNAIGLSDKAIVNLFEKADIIPREMPNLSEPHICCNVHGELFFTFPCGNTTRVYKKLPLVNDDSRFKWIKRENWCGRDRVVYTTALELGYLQVKIKYFLDGDETGIQFYEKYGRGTHRHLGAEWIEHGNNDDIAATINEWIEEFKTRTQNIQLL